MQKLTLIFLRTMLFMTQFEEAITINPDLRAQLRVDANELEVRIFRLEMSLQ